MKNCLEKNLEIYVWGAIYFCGAELPHSIAQIMAEYRKGQLFKQPKFFCWSGMLLLLVHDKN
jgi:hypothetical protein